ncbi:hypothetical protein [Hymenobacter sublimis]|uniref:Uncharacterized protein n=1 Tax=Hymenobacter sublimis TaxID=2933777 RepID=A0ABY4J6S6_9BACT|nr:hypothetical protein [Hymenobacter sublimis]UPL48531.1 hypothetical protein MWH26_15225 [Hymenobacter sublimis]
MLNTAQNEQAKELGHIALFTEALPSDLVRSIEESDLPDEDLSSAVIFCKIILRFNIYKIAVDKYSRRFLKDMLEEHYVEYKDESYHEIEKGTFKQYNPDWERVIFNLIKLDIIQILQCKNNSRTKKGKHFVKYRINPKLLNNEFATIDFLSTNQIVNAGTYWGGIEKQIRTDFGKIVFDAIGARASMKKSLATLDPSVWLVTQDSVEYKYNLVLTGMLFTNGKQVAPIRTRDLLDNILLEDQHHGKRLFLINKEYVVEKPDVFIQQVREQLQASHERTIASLERGDFWIKEDQSTGYIHTSLSLIPDPLLPFLTVDGESVTKIMLRENQLPSLIYLIGSALQYYKRKEYTRPTFRYLEVALPVLAPSKQVTTFLRHARQGVLIQKVAKALQLDVYVVEKNIVQWLLNEPEGPCKQALTNLYGPVLGWIEEAKNLLKNGTPDTTFGSVLHKVGAKVIRDLYTRSAIVRSDRTLFPNGESLIVKASSALSVGTDVDTYCEKHFVPHAYQFHIPEGMMKIRVMDSNALPCLFYL